MIRRFALVCGLLLLTTACPVVERKVYTFDLAAKTGQVLLVNVRSDDASKAVNDFLEVLEKAVQGTHFEEKHPKWRITSKELVANGGNLDGVVKFTFDSVADAGIYKHDKKSPYLWCTTEAVISTNGRRIDDVLPGCVVWDKTATKLEITTKEGEFLGSEVSLLPYFERWKAGEALVRVPDEPTLMEAEPAAEPAPQ